MSVPTPRFETSRLAALRAAAILDTPKEAFSESIAVYAAMIANVPMSAISLIDADRQWFKGSCGLDVRETPRDISFCAHAILETQPMVVPDTRLDDRFNANPMVTGKPHVRFYAGFPLLVLGQALGTLCVIDDRPRNLSTDQVRRLIGLAAMTSEWLRRSQPRVA